MHNEVNKMLHKDIFDCSKIGDFYDCGCAHDEDDENANGKSKSGGASGGSSGGGGGGTSTSKVQNVQGSEKKVGKENVQDPVLEKPEIEGKKKDNLDVEINAEP